MPKVMKRFRKDGILGTEKYTLFRPTEVKTKVYRALYRKPNPYTTKEVRLTREQLLTGNYWTGCEARKGIEDLRPMIYERDNYNCQTCDNSVTWNTAQLDHIKPVRKFKKPVDANVEENLQTLCIECHKNKTQKDNKWRAGCA